MMSKSYIVAGGFGVLGRGVCAYLAEIGHKVAAVDLAPAPTDFAGHGFGGVDLGDEAAVAAAYASAAEALGGLDGVVNVAGGFLWETVADGAIASWDRMFAMNVRTAAVLSKAALAYLQSGGAIVNVGAAAAAQRVAAGMTPYAASKAGVMALTEGMAEELRAQHIRVNAVLPTMIDTPTNRKDMPDADFSTWVSPRAAAQTIAFLLSDEASAVTGVGIRLSV
jgi:NAD(P)-dependent dehydrogenase (short-subunit alcohol dehydrogenase family)